MILLEIIFSRLQKRPAVVDDDRPRIRVLRQHVQNDMSSPFES